ncbi:MAG: PASTA domain-containing protein, partial [Actinobacteria bacterium]|nr:PASTA domain-containing protein [Actinomycetota bacterium]
LVLVPDLSGMKINDALQEIKNAGLSDVTINEEYSETVKTDIVISQNPESGTPVEKNTAVNLSVSMGPQFITVPDIIGYDYSTARSNLESIGLITVFKLKTDLSVQPGTVISIEPAEGTHVYKNSTVVVFISTSQQLATVPDLTGMDFEKAVGVLEGMQIEYEVSPVKVDYSIQRNSVIAQFPEAGDQILQNERIILFVGQ